MALTLDQALQKGVEAHKSGKAQEADRYYTAILKANPKHPDANHNMGVLAVGVGKVEGALPFFKTALEANPKMEQFWLSYIDALIKLDRIAEATAVLEKAKSNGINSDGFDQLEIRHGSSTSPNPDTQEPTNDQLHGLVGLYTKGHYHEALDQGSQLLEQFPNSVNLHHIIGATNKGLGKLEVAIEAYAKALALKPDYADAYYNMGNALKEQRRLDKAIEAYAKALAITPDYADAYYNMGIALGEQGKPEEAIQAYNKALAINPDFTEAYNNMGNALKEQGKLEEAIQSYNKALAIKSNYAEAYNNMGSAFQDQGKLEASIEAYTKAISLKPHYADAYNNMGNALKGLIFTKPNKDLQKTIVAILDTATYVRPKNIAKAAISLLKFEPSLQKQLQLFDTDGLEDGLLDVISDLSELSLLLKLMSVCPLPDLELEKLLKNLRQSILLNVSALKEKSPELLSFQSALALQCFTNEYIYNCTDEEERILQSLEVSIRRDLENNNQPSPQILLALASYKALNEYDWCKSLIITDEIKEVFIRQIDEPNQEKKLKQCLPTLEGITDSVSAKVRAQYEESPYPRWVNLGLSLKPFSILAVVDQIKLKLYDNKITGVRKPEIMIAGCGTGQHSIGTAARFKSSRILAIDLSLSSLAYAKRKTDELGIKNIEYIQADILELGYLNKQFDIIESAGVLHHMDNPMAGWKILTDCLKPGGLMRIGLYSELARQHIVKTRKEISKACIGSSHAAMRSFRDVIIKSDKDHHKLITTSADFYSLSMLRDLLFHVQEHRFTIAQLKEYLDKLGLKFCGFESNKIVSQFKATKNKANDPYDLDAWQAYEEANPRAFAGMYQFWCQKVD